MLLMPDMHQAGSNPAGKGEITDLCECILQLTCQDIICKTV